MTLVGKKGLHTCNLVKDLEQRSSWIFQMGPKSSDKLVVTYYSLHRKLTQKPQLYTMFTMAALRTDIKRDKKGTEAGIQEGGQQEVVADAGSNPEPHGLWCAPSSRHPLREEPQV